MSNDMLSPRVERIEPVLARFQAPAEVLKAMGHGSVLWRGNDYYVHVDVNPGEILQPYMVTIGRVDGHLDLPMAYGVLSDQFDFLHGEFGGEGLTADEADIASYLDLALQAIDAAPDFVCDDTDDDDGGLGEVLELAAELDEDMV